MSENAKYRVGLGVAGGIAAYKAVEIVRGLQKAGCAVRVAMTRHACEFIQPLTFRALTNEYVLVDDYAPENPDPIAHINFSQTIDLLLIAPATANIVAKFANGIADDFLSSTYLAATAPVLIAPAMNTTMWFHAATQRNIERLRTDGVRFVEPAAGELACQTIGVGKLNDVETIVEQALKILSRTSRASRPESKSLTQDSRLKTQDLANERILIAVGGTREEIDPVRFVSNHSSGKMGFALAETAAARGARVTIIKGATTAPLPENARVIEAVSAAQMFDAVMRELKNSTVYIGAAAVADYRPARRASEKIKKSESDLTLVLEKTADILAEVSRNRHEGLLVVGFAAETNDVLEHARAKMRSKNLDLIIANDVSRADSGFGAENNVAAILRRDAENALEFPLLSKRELADRILDEVIKLRKNN